MDIMEFCMPQVVFYQSLFPAGIHSINLTTLTPAISLVPNSPSLDISTIDHMSTYGVRDDVDVK